MKREENGGIGAAAARLRRHLLLVAVLAAVVYLGLAVYADLDSLGEAFAAFSWYYLPPALALVLFNYLLRFLKWQLLLRAVEIHVPRLLSLLVFVSGLTMTISPAKLGEVLKSFMLRERRGVPVSRSAPVVVAERATDVIGVVVLGAAGALTYRGGRGVLAVALVLMLAFVALVQWRSLCLRLLGAAERLPLVSRYYRQIEEFYLHSHVLFKARNLLPAAILSTAGWFCECIAAWLCLRGLGVELPLLLVTFVFVVASLAGALAMLPGGVGVAEAGMAGLLVVNGVERGAAVAGTLLIRLTTFWFAIALGLVGVFIYRLVYGDARPAGSQEAEPRREEEA